MSEMGEDGGYNLPGSEGHHSPLDELSLNVGMSRPRSLRGEHLNTKDLLNDELASYHSMS